MNLRHVVSCGLIGAALVLTGCDKGRQDPPEVDVRVLNAAPGFGELEFQRESRGTAPRLVYKGTHDARYDLDSYDFFVAEVPLIEGATRRTWTFNPQLQADRAYTFVLTQVAGEVVPVVMENQAAPTSDAQIQALHAAESMPALDLYLERPGVGIAGATPRGTFNVQGQISARTLPSGDYEVWVTEAGNPANVLLTSSTITLDAGVTATFVVLAEPGLSTPTVTLALLQPSSAILFDRNVGGELRVINAAADMAPRDFAVNSEFSPPLFSAIPFGEPTAYAPAALSLPTVNVTPVGNPGVLEFSGSFAVPALQRATFLFTGPAGTLTPASVNDDGRRYLTEAKLLFLNAATQFSAVDFIIVPPGADPTGAVAISALPAPGTSAAYQRIPPGTYDLYLRQNTTTTLLSGPTPITLAAGGIYGILSVNGADTATAQVRLFDDFL